jgi:hypothetical protein
LEIGGFTSAILAKKVSEQLCLVDILGMIVFDIKSFLFFFSGVLWSGGGGVWNQFFFALYQVMLILNGHVAICR